MRKKLSHFVLIILPLILAACGGGVSEDQAEEAIRDAFAGRINEANEVICDEEQMDSEDAADVEGIEVSEVSCQQDGDVMACTYNVTVAGVATEQETSFRIQDDKLCSGIGGVSVNPAVIDDVAGEENQAESPGAGDVSVDEEDPQAGGEATPGTGLEAPESP